MNKGELVAAIANDAGLSNKDAGAALNATIVNITKALKKGDTVTLVGFGTFSVAKRKARMGRNPQTGEAIKIKAAKVEVSADDRQTWEPAEVRKPLSPYTWVIWTRSWDAQDPGLQRIWVRATDGAGEVQTAEAKASLPSGATGRHHIFVVVQEPDGSPPDLPELDDL